MRVGWSANWKKKERIWIQSNIEWNVLWNEEWNESGVKSGADSEIDNFTKIKSIIYVIHVWTNRTVSAADVPSGIDGLGCHFMSVWCISFDQWTSRWRNYFVHELHWGMAGVVGCPRERKRDNEIIPKCCRYINSLKIIPFQSTYYLLIFSWCYILIDTYTLSY